MVTASPYRYAESVAVLDSKYAKQGGFTWQCCTLGQFFGVFSGRLKGYGFFEVWIGIHEVHEEHENLFNTERADLDH